MTNHEHTPIKVFALHIGDTKVPYGQFYGGLDGWVGARGVWRFLTDKRHFITVPIHAYFIEHPTAGPMLVDTGINWQQAHEHNRYYKGWLLHLLLDEDEYQLTREQELGAHLTRLGYRPEDVRIVILTHLHEDHVGGLRVVPGATVVLAEQEYRAKLAGVYPYAKVLEAAGTSTIRTVSYDSGPLACFERTQDLFGDGTIFLLPTPGHTAGHQCVLVRTGEDQLLITGDALYSLRHLAVEEVRAIVIGGRRQLTSARRIQQFRHAFPDLIVAPLHDHTAYMRELLVPALADGVLSPEERHAIRAYERRVFDAGGHLLPSAVPRYIPSGSDASSGTVTEP